VKSENGERKMGNGNTGNLTVNERLVSVYVERNKPVKAGFGYSEKFTGEG